jgi:hypothetical protein
MAALVCLVLQLGLAAFVPLADAGLEAGGDPGPHVEAAGTDGCPVQHDHLACQFCRTLRSGSGPLPQRSPSPEWAAAVAVPTCAAQQVLPSARLAGPFGARAPPVL